MNKDIEAKIHELETKRNMIDQHIVTLKLAAGLLNGHPANEPIRNTSPEETPKNDGTSRIHDRIISILSSSSNPIKLGVIRTRIHKEFGKLYRTSTIKTETGWLFRIGKINRSGWGRYQAKS